MPWMILLREWNEKFYAVWNEGQVIHVMKNLSPEYIKKLNH